MSDKPTATKEPPWGWMREASPCSMPLRPDFYPIGYPQRRKEVALLKNGSRVTFSSHTPEDVLVPILKPPR